MRSCRFSSFLLAALFLSSMPALADKDKAKELFKKGMTAYKLDHFDDAITAFEAAYAEETSPVFLFNIAQSHRLARRPRPALEFYKKYLKDSPTAPNRAQVEEQIASLTSEVKKLDDEEAAKKAAEDEKAARLKQQEEAQRAIAQTPAPVEEKPKSKRWPLWLGIGAGAAVVVAGGVTAGVLLANPSTPSLGLEDAR